MKQRQARISRRSAPVLSAVHQPEEWRRRAWGYALASFLALALLSHLHFVPFACLKSTPFSEIPSLDTVLESRWQAAYRRGVFRTTTERSLPKRTIRNGQLSFSLALNEGRQQKRQTLVTAAAAAADPGDHENALQLTRPFIEADFHFGKVDSNEYLFIVDEVADRVRCGPVADLHQHAVLINPFPLGWLSGLLVPYLLEHRPQVMTRDALTAGFAFAQRLQNPYTRLAFNSLEAGASVNHLHFQFWQFDAPLAVELATRQLYFRFGEELTLHILPDAPVHTLAVEYFRTTATGAIVVVQRIIDLLYQHVLPFNLVFSRYYVNAGISPSRSTVYIVLRQRMHPFPGINIGFPEVSGELICTSSSIYHSVTAHNISQHWRDNVRLSGDRYTEFLGSLKRHLPTLLSETT
ncbi:uncharacterized protein MONBRDRAFT_11778 [Monosiga brevicollis MX1]|uniref:GDP-D-glucose phosphorylase 1 n=1 Tax=Monosiga brevicollis TaxID=81824 RepID=A9VA94_MONBE|nr:uncharacterized protein MONBRDRAFT_11778 [Monosiga brevicollis MX1]EDQ85447.1 predicted protein [Monosiga brevicollis MX1]|eukprot:XP_001749638.1 hypothetical protein [Monosiga brevicollis MX1]